MAVPPAPRRLPLVRVTGLALAVALMGFSLVCWWLLYVAAGASGAILGLRSFDART